MTQEILFLCPHNAAKSVIAVAYFNQMASKEALPFTADSAGTEPDQEVSPIVAAMLAAEGIDVSQHVPRYVTPELLQNAMRIISMGCTREELGMTGERVEFWSDLPLVSQEPERTRALIRTHVEELIQELMAIS